MFGHAGHSLLAVCSLREALHPLPVASDEVCTPSTIYPWGFSECSGVLIGAW